MPAVDATVSPSLAGPRHLVDDLALIARYVLVSVAVLVVHWGFDPVLVSLLGLSWIYDILFFPIAVVPFGSIVCRVYTSLDPLTAFVM